MFTAIDLRDGKTNHHEYYAQFVNESVKQCVIGAIGIDRLMATGGNLNDISLHVWDRLPMRQCIDTELFKVCNNATYGERDRHKFIWCLSYNVCIAKTAARIIIEENTAR